MIAVAILAYNRLDLLRRCVENVALRTSSATTEIVVWDNASTDGTAAYLDSLEDSRVRVVHHGSNIGLNAFAALLPTTTADYLITLDEDVIDAPTGWDATLLDAFQRLPGVGLLATNQVDDPHSECAWIMHHRDRHLYQEHEERGVRLWEGPVGGWCMMTSRAIHDLVGGFPTSRHHPFFHHDEAFIRAIAPHGYRAAILADLAVLHASGPHYSEIFGEKERYYEAQSRRWRRRQRAKRVLWHLPGVPALNSRHRWFEPPSGTSSERAGGR